MTPYGSTPSCADPIDGVEETPEKSGELHHQPECNLAKMTINRPTKSLVEFRLPKTAMIVSDVWEVHEVTQEETSPQVCLPSKKANRIPQTCCE